MKELNINIKVEEYLISEIPEWIKPLIQSATEASKNAYAPYSHFKVGAAALLVNGKIIKSANQENAAYPSGLCAERVAVFYAQTTFPNQAIKALAICAFNHDNQTHDPIFPCGACRQVLLEHENIHNSPITLIFIGKEKIYVVNSASDMLPLNFNSDSLLK